jgi:hypothetical protein
MMDGRGALVLSPPDGAAAAPVPALARAAGDPTPLTASRTYQWIHSLPRILGALTATGLVLDLVHEHPWLPWPPFPMCIPNGNGAYCPPKGAPPLPLAVSLRAVKSHTART